MFSKTLSNSGEEYNGNFYTIKEINNSLKVIINQSSKVPGYHIDNRQLYSKKHYKNGGSKNIPLFFII